MDFGIENDGVDHINVYSRGKTELGRFLTNFARAPMDTEDGPFESMEGYWYWLSCSHPDRDRLRKAWGFQAKKLGREMRGADWVGSPEFKDKIGRAIRAKVLGNPEMHRKLRENRLPLAHYYAFGGKIVEPKDGEWILDHIRSLAGEPEPAPARAFPGIEIY